MAKPKVTLNPRAGKRRVRKTTKSPAAETLFEGKLRERLATAGRFSLPRPVTRSSTTASSRPKAQPETLFTGELRHGVAAKQNAVVLLATETLRAAVRAELLSPSGPWPALGTNGNRLASKALEKELAEIAETVFGISFNMAFNASQKLKYPSSTYHFLRMWKQAMRRHLDTRYIGGEK